MTRFAKYSYCAARVSHHSVSVRNARIPIAYPLPAAPNLIVVPHVGSATERTRAAMADMAAGNLLAALRGEQMP